MLLGRRRVALALSHGRMVLRDCFCTRCRPLLQGATRLATVSGDRREIAAVFEESIFRAMSPAERDVVGAIAPRRP